MLLSVNELVASHIGQQNGKEHHSCKQSGGEDSHRCSTARGHLQKEGEKEMKLKARQGDDRDENVG